MPVHHPDEFARRAATALALAAVLPLLAACSERADAPTTAPAAAPVPAAAAPAPVAVPPAPTAVPAAAAPAAPRSVPANVQGVAAAGATVRVKGIELGTDATVLKVSMSYANRIASTTLMALTDTYLEDDRGNRLMLQRPAGNRDLTLRDGETLEGELVFMGSVAPTAASLKLVFNDGNQPDNIAGPGLVMALPLSP